MEKLRKIIQIKPPYDKRHKDPKKNYGIGSLSFWMILKGKAGAVQVMFSTALYPIEVMQEKSFKTDFLCKKTIDVWDVGYHARTPQFESQTSMDCTLLKEKKCYYDGSSIRGNNLGLGELFLEKGEDAIWEFLLEEYKNRFNVEEAEIQEYWEE